MSMEFTKILSSSERRHRYWQLHKNDRNFFPEKFQSFKLKFKGKIYEMKVNNRDCIMTGQLYKNHQFVDGETIRITIDKEGFYLMQTDSRKPLAR